ncbi:MAG: HDOD domain-containing protein [Oryzomonas sp.]|uniref:EAL and HDOD domain-containing protein n=1 Tax=Oryzomonas sp. TaxID=2855186 RepID=UPI0028409200|nr:HDOD domain-containing protein [Oryzomonas sp.]MDR3579584.1 HDOD domain-containing protein [Oryzomonas sp.]
MQNEAYLIGRQPILNRSEEITAFELLFRSQESISSAKFENATQASSRVICNMLSTMGIENLLGKQRGYVNVDQDLLLSDVIELLPQQLVGLELLESIEITPDVVKRCRELKAHGYMMALDDHEYSPLFEPLYDGLVDIVKIDLFTTPLSKLPEMVGRFRRYPVKLLAEKVDSRDVYLRCRSMGIELFQGYFFARPTLIRKQRMVNSINSFLKLMQQLKNGAEINELEATFKESPPLIYQLLMLVNSVTFGMREKIRTIRHAITIIGMQQLKRWVQIALFAENGHQEFTNPIMHMAIVRATFMEELARIQTQSFSCSPDEAFMVGILSILKDVYDIPLDDMVTSLNLSDYIKNAIFKNKGDISILLSMAKMIERNELEKATEGFAILGISISVVVECQNKAFNWQNGLV